MACLTLLTSLLAVVVCGPESRAAELDSAQALLVGGVPLDVEHDGHAAPCVADFDGDGIKDLLVGEQFQGRLRIYRNLGTDRERRFEGYSVFLDGAPEGRVPVG